MSAITNSSPPARRRPRWRLPLIAAGGLVLGLAVVAGGAVGTYPYWADGIVESAVVKRIEKMTGAQVTMEGFDLEYSSVEMRGVTVTVDADTTIRLDLVEVTLDSESVWSAQARVTDVVVAGGAVTGDVAAFERLAVDFRPAEEDRALVGTLWKGCHP